MLILCPSVNLPRLVLLIRFINLLFPYLALSVASSGQFISSHFVSLRCILILLSTYIVYASHEHEVHSPEISVLKL